MLYLARLKKLITNEWFHLLLLPVIKWFLKNIIVVAIILFLASMLICQRCKKSKTTGDDTPQPKETTQPEIERRAERGFTPEVNIPIIGGIIDDLRYTYPTTDSAPAFVPSPTVALKIENAVDVKQFGRSKNGIAWANFTKGGESPIKIHTRWAKTNEFWTALTTPEGIEFQSVREPLFKNSFFALGPAYSANPFGLIDSFNLSTNQLGLLTIGYLNFRPWNMGLVGIGFLNLSNSTITTGIVKFWN